MAKKDEKKYTKSQILKGTFSKSMIEDLKAKRSVVGETKNTFLKLFTDKKEEEGFFKDKNISERRYYGPNNSGPGDKAYDLYLGFIEDSINPDHKDFNHKLAWEFEQYHKAQLTMLINQSDELIAKNKELVAQEKTGNILSGKKTLEWKHLEYDMGMDTSFLKTLAQNPMKAQKIVPGIKIAVKNILVKKMIAIADEKNLREDDIFTHYFRQKYVTKTGERYVLDGTKINNTLESPDLSIFKDLRKFKTFYDIEISGKELIGELTDIGYDFKKKTDKKNPNIYNNQSLSNRRFLSDFFSWRYYNQPKMTKEKDKSREQINEELKQDMESFGNDFFGKGGIRGNGLSEIFEQQIISNDNTVSNGKNSYNDILQRETLTLHQFREGVDPFDKQSKNKPHFVKENILPRLENKIYGAKLNVEKYKTKKYQQELSRLQQLYEKIKHDPNYVVELNKRSKGKEEISNLQNKIDNFKFTEENTNDLKDLENKLLEQKNSLLIENIKRYLVLAQNNKDTNNETIFSILLNLSQQDFDFSKISNEEKNLLVQKIFGPRVKAMFGNTNGLKALGLQEDAINEFIDDLLNFNTSESIIKLPNKKNPNNPLELQIEKKITNAWNINNMNIEDLISIPPRLDEIGDLPIQFNINLDKLDEDQLWTVEHCPLMHNNGVINTMQTSQGSQAYSEQYKVMVRGSYQGFWSKTTNEELDNEIFYEADNLPGGRLYPEAWNEDGQKMVTVLIDDNGNPVRDSEDKLILNILGEEQATNNQKVDILQRNIHIDGKNINQLFQLFYYFNGNIDEYVEQKKTKIKKHQNINKLNKLNLFPKKMNAEDLEEVKKTKTQQTLKNFVNNVDLALIQEDKEFDPTTIDYGDTTNENYKKEVEHNALLDDKERISEADKKLSEIAGFNRIEYNGIDETKKQAILEAHAIGRDEAGTDGKIPATIFHYTQDQIKRKLEILKKAGFKTWERKTLLLFGFCGEVEKKISKAVAKTFANEIEKQYQDSTPESEKFDDEQWREFDDKIKNEYRRFTNPEAKDAFTKTLQDRYDAINDTTGTGGETPAEKRKLKEVLDNLHVNNRSNSTEDSGNTSEENHETNLDEENKTPKEEFEATWKGLDGDQATEFKIGSSIYLNIGDSNYPPKHNDKAWLKLEITSLPTNFGPGGTFGVRFYNATTDIEGLDSGISKEIPATAEMLKSWTTTLGTSKVIKVQKEENPNNFEQAFNTMFKAGLLDDFSHIFAKEGEEKVWEKNGKFWKTNKEGKDIEIKYFSNTKSLGKKDQLVGRDTEFFEIQSIKNGKVTFKTVRSDLHPDKPGENVNYTMERTLSYSAFILLMEDKQLVGYKKNPNDESKNKDKTKRERDSTRGDTKFFSLNDVFGAVKTGWKKVVDEKLKAYNDSESERFGNLLFSEEGLNLFGKASNFFGIFGGLTAGFAEACDMAQAEYYSEREDRAWKQINYRYGIFDKDPHYGTLWHNRLKHLFMISPEKINKSDHIRYKFAAAMLITIKKDGPWTKFLKDKPGQGFWVERLLGENHKKRFKDIQELKKRELQNHEKLNHVHWKNPRTTMLARLEFDYIIGVIDGRKPYGDGDADEGFMASRWSRKFVEQLQENTDKYFGSAVKKAEEIKDVKDFPRSQQEYYRHMGTMRPHKAIPFLLNMARTAQSTLEMNQVKRAILGALLSGMLWNHADHTTRTELWKISRSMGFIPGTWIREQNQKEMVWALLKHVTGGDITSQLKVGGVNYATNKFAVDENSSLVNFIVKDFPEYWSRHGNKILEQLEIKTPESRIGPKSILTLAHDTNNPDHWIGKKYITPEFDLENDDQETRYIYQYAEESPWTASKSLVRHYIPQNGKFIKQTDEVEIEGAKAFWRSVTTNLNSISGPKDFELFFSRFHSWFSENVFNQGNLTNLLKSISLVQRLKNKNRTQEGKYILWYALYGSIIQSVGGAPAEFSGAINKFVDVMRDGIEYFNLGMANNILGNYTNTIERDYESKPYKMINPNDWLRFHRFSYASGTDSARTDFIRNFDEDDYVWYNIKNTRDFFKKHNSLGEEPTPPRKTVSEQLVA